MATFPDRPAGHVLSIDAFDQPRTMAAITTLICGRGHHLEWLDSTPYADGRLAVSVQVSLDGAGAHRLALQLERLTTVERVRVLAPGERALPTCLRRYEVTTRGSQEGSRSEAIVVLQLHGGRHLGAGEGPTRAAALSDALVAALASGGLRVGGEVATSSVRRRGGWTGVVELDVAGDRATGTWWDTAEERAVAGAVLDAVGGDGSAGLRAAG
jgi:acetolactate synthase regulatory subunit